MDRRRFDRIISGFDTVLKCEGKLFAGTVDNLSGSGLCIVTVPADIPFEFEPETAFELELKSCSGETLTMNCVLKWSRKVLPHGLTKKIGLQIVDSPWEISWSFV